MRRIITAREQFERHQAMPTFYHYTTPEAAESIRSNGFRPGLEKGQRPDAVFFTSDPESAYAKDYGSGRVEVDFPDDMVNAEYGEFGQGGWLDDEFPNGEQHWAIPSDEIRPEWIRQAMPTLYHYTSPENAQSIRDQGKFESPYGDPNAWFTEHRGDAGLDGYGGAEVRVNVPDDYPLERIDPRREHGVDSDSWIPIPSKDIRPEWIER